MTFIEASNNINENMTALMRDTLYSNPPHRIDGWIIAPRNCFNHVTQKIFSECGKNIESNELVLSNMDLLGEDLIPYVALTVWGHFIIIPLFSYLTSPWDFDGNDS